MLTVPDLLVRGLDLPPLDIPPVPVPPGTRCAMTGVDISSGYPILSLVSDATAEFLDTFRGHPGGYLCESAARAFKAQRLTSRNAFIFADGTSFQPFISRNSANKDPGRPCWSDLVRDVWPSRYGQECYIMLTTDMKKRLWPRARVGVLGHATALYLYDSGLSAAGTRFLDWPALLGCLDLIEDIYTAGFVKENIRFSLWSYYKMVQEVGIGQTREWEAELEGWRQRPEFDAALMIAQKREEPE